VSLKNAAKPFGLVSHLGRPDPTNVGHFSARPDYFELAQIELRDAPIYVLTPVHRESAVLETKSKRLGGFDARAFRQDLWDYLAEPRRTRSSDDD
jgi:hypothetical protein